MNLRGLPPQPGLFVESTPGSEVWDTAEGLTPGDKLHEGVLYGCITDHQHWQLIEICGIEEAWGHGFLLNALDYIIGDYKLFTRFERQNGPFGPHLRRLAEIGKLAKRLRRLLADEPLGWRLMWPIVRPQNYERRAVIKNF